MAFDMLLETGEDISVKVFSQKDFEARKGFSFIRNVISEGVKIASLPALAGSLLIRELLNDITESLKDCRRIEI